MEGRTEEVEARKVGRLSGHLVVVLALIVSRGQIVYREGYSKRVTVSSEQ